MRCYNCGRTFRCPEGEEGEHDCPYCCYSAFNYDLSDPDRDHEDEYDCQNWMEE